MGFSRCGSFASLADFGAPEGSGPQNLALDPARVANIRNDLLVGFPKQAVHIKDSDFSLKLLELEKTLVRTMYGRCLLTVSGSKVVQF
jgi:hypothetical protein